MLNVFLLNELDFSERRNSAYWLDSLIYLD